MKILNFGSLNIDNVYTVSHFVRPGETLATEQLDLFCGGKGLNQSIALSKAGATVYHAGKIGEDGKILLDILQEHGVNTQWVEQAAGRSGHAVIQVDASGQNCILLYGGTNQQITEEQIDRTLSDFGPGDLLLLQNEINGLDLLLIKAAQKEMQIALNPSPVSPKLLEMPLENVTLFVFNEIEGEMLSGVLEPDQMLAAIRKKYPSAVLLLTLGKHGAVYDDGIRRLRHGIYDVPRVDTTGAGDTFTGYFLARTAAGDSPELALELASVASSIAVSRSDAAASIPKLDEVLRAREVLKPVIV